MAVTIDLILNVPVNVKSYSFILYILDIIDYIHILIITVYPWLKRKI